MGFGTSCWDPADVRASSSLRPRSLRALHSVACLTASVCIVAGSDSFPSSPQNGVITVTGPGGDRQTQVTSPDAGTQSDIDVGPVACASGTCVALGQLTSTSPWQSLLITITEPA
jgi:hypothetical protein